MKHLTPERRRQRWQAQRIAAVGTELAVATVIGLAGGHWLDERFGTRPYLGLFGVLIGVAAGMKGLYTLSREYERSARSAPTSSPTDTSSSNEDPDPKP